MIGFLLASIFHIFKTSLFVKIMLFSFRHFLIVKFCRVQLIGKYIAVVATYFGFFCVLLAVCKVVFCSLFDSIKSRMPLGFISNS